MYVPFEDLNTTLSFSFWDYQVHSDPAGRRYPGGFTLRPAFIKKKEFYKPASWLVSTRNTCSVAHIDWVPCVLSKKPLKKVTEKIQRPLSPRGLFLFLKFKNSGGSRPILIGHPCHNLKAVRAPPFRKTLKVQISFLVPEALTLWVHCWQHSESSPEHNKETRILILKYKLSPRYL